MSSYFVPINLGRRLGNSWDRRPVSRVLSHRRSSGDDHSSGASVTGRLARPTRAAAPKTRLPVRTRRSGRPAAPTWSCSRWGLPCRFRCRTRGALLPHPFTLARRCRPGGLLSVALSLGSPPPGVTRHRVFRGARTFLPGREPGAVIRPPVPGDHLGPRRTGVNPGRTQIRNLGDPAAGLVIN